MKCGAGLRALALVGLPRPPVHQSNLRGTAPGVACPASLCWLALLAPQREPPVVRVLQLQIIYARGAVGYLLA